MARGLPECGFEQVSVQPGLIAGLQYAAYRTAGLEERCRLRISGPQPGEEWLAVQRVLAQNLTENGQHGFLTLAVSGALAWTTAREADFPPGPALQEAGGLPRRAAPPR